MAHKKIKPINKNSIPEINQYFSQVIGKAPWFIYSGIGAMLAMNFGRMKHNERKTFFIAEYHFLIENHNWEIQQKGKTHVRSDSSRLDILENILLPIGEMLESIQINLKKNEYSMIFDHDITLSIFIDPSVDKEEFINSTINDWILFLPTGEAIGFGPGLFYNIEYSSKF